MSARISRTAGPGISGPMPAAWLRNRLNCSRARSAALQLSQVGIYAPRGTPAPVLDRLEEACRTALETPAVRQVLDTTRSPAAFMPRAALNAMLRDEYTTYGRILKELGVQPE